MKHERKAHKWVNASIVINLLFIDTRKILKLMQRKL